MKGYTCVVLNHWHPSIVPHICRAQDIQDDIVCIWILETNSAYSCILQVHNMLARPPNSTSTLMISDLRFVSIPNHWHPALLAASEVTVPTLYQDKHMVLNRLELCTIMDEENVRWSIQDAIPESFYFCEVWHDFCNFWGALVCRNKEKDVTESLNN